MRTFTEEEVTNMVEKLGADSVAFKRLMDDLDVSQYPPGLTLEFSNNGTDWEPHRFVEHNEKVVYPWGAEHGCYIFARYPIDWGKLPASYEAVVEFKSGIRMPVHKADDCVLGQVHQSWGTVVWVEKRR